MKPDKDNSIKRFILIIIVLCLVCVYIISKAAHTIFYDNEYWIEVSKTLIKENIEISATRGNIYDCKGRLMAGSVPEYILYMDFVAYDKDSLIQAKAQAWRDSVFFAELDSISVGLARIFPDKKRSFKENTKWYRERLLHGHKRKSRSYRIYPKIATYIQFKECKELPLFRESSNKGGFYTKTIMQRKHPYGSLAYRTLGSLRTDSNAAKNGLELSFDSILRGKNGIGHSMKVRNKRIQIIDKEPEDGHDLISTIDVDIQDMAEKILVSKLQEHDIKGELGMVIVMEVATGEVKAIVNMHRGSDGKYYEMKNSAVSDLMEPGSTFKTASMMLALDEGKATLSTTVDCAPGIYPMYGRKMKDHNWNKGGYKVLTFSNILEYSSNIGVSRIIDDAFKDDPQKFVDGLRRMGVGIPLNLPFVGKGEPLIPQPNSKKRYWSKSDLPWMSIGYVTQQPVISTLTFYNAIANNGKMVKPKFVKAEMYNGELIREFPTEVLIEQICKPSTLKDIQYCLNNVVSIGLGKAAGNGGRLFQVSGKTGTAQIANGKAGYKNGTPRYMISFCGYFPSEAPKYSCIVSIVKQGLPASGGTHCGPVFRQISQYIMAKNFERNAAEIADSLSVFNPSNKKRPNMAENENLSLIPDAVGFGAKDAVYLMKKKGINVKLEGKGTVESQSIKAGTKIEKGQSITLYLK